MTYDNLFDPGALSQQSETLPWDVLFLNAIQSKLYDVHTALPAVIVGLRSASAVDVQFQLKRAYKNGTVVTLPVAQNIPVVMPRGADYWVQLPIALGDTGLVVFSERSLDAWNVSGGTVDPADPRTHDLSDAVFIPGLYPSSMPVAAATPDLVVHNGLAELHLQKAGTFTATNGTNELMSLLVQLVNQNIAILEQLEAATTNTVFGPEPLNNAAAFVSIQSAVQEILTNLQTLVGS